ncbi:hypothetical protein FOZ63_027982, partial [Perkinsus olseni]
VSGLRECGLNPHRAITANPRLVLTASHDENGILNDLPSRASLLRRMGVSEADVPYYLTSDNLPDEQTVERECGDSTSAEAAEVVTEMAGLSNSEFRKAFRHRPSETKVDEAVRKKSLRVEPRNGADCSGETHKDGEPCSRENIVVDSHEVARPKKRFPKSTIELPVLTEALQLIMSQHGVVSSSELARVWCEEHADRNVLHKCDRAVVEVFAKVVLESGTKSQCME